MRRTVDFSTRKSHTDTSVSFSQESLQGAPGAFHEDDHWLPVSHRHGHKERLDHQEQICGLRHAHVPLPFPRLIRRRCILFTLQKAIWRTQQCRTTCQIVPQPPRDTNRKTDDLAIFLNTNNQRYIGGYTECDIL